MPDRFQSTSAKDVSAPDEPRRLPVGLITALCLGFLTAGTVAAATDRAEIHKDRTGKEADFQGMAASEEAHLVADWVLAEVDNQGLPFIIVDKVNATVFVFDAAGMLRGAAPVLLGLARSDDTPAGIGHRHLSSISPAERVTPAGRFVVSAGHNLAKKDILWVDYESSLSLHAVITSNASEHRLQRLESPSAIDNRISFGCINVPADFYESILKKYFTNTNGIIYILPEVKSIYDVFFISRLRSRPPAGR